MLALFSISCGMYHPPRASVQWVFLIQARPEIEEEEVTLRKCMYRIVFMWLAHLLSIWIAFSYSLPHRMFPVGVIESHTPISSSTRNKGNHKWKLLRGMVWDIGKSRQESSHCWRHSQDLWAGDHCWSVAIPSSNLCPSLRGRERSHPFLWESSWVCIAAFPFSFCFHEWNNLTYPCSITPKVVKSYLSCWETPQQSKSQGVSLSW